MNDFKTLGDATRLIAEKSLKVDDNALTQYIKSAVEMVDRRGESIEDYALIKVNNPMQMTDDFKVTITSQWRLIHVDKLVNVPRYDEDEETDLHRIYRLEEASKFIGLSVVTLRRYIKDGRLPAKKRGKNYIVTERDLKAL